MPKVHLTLEERRKAEIERIEKAENFNIRSILRDKIKNNLGYEYIAEKTKISKVTIGKIVNHPELAKVAQLRAVCAAANIPLALSVKSEPE